MIVDCKNINYKLSFAAYLIQTQTDISEESKSFLSVFSISCIEVVFAANLLLKMPLKVKKKSKFISVIPRLLCTAVFVCFVLAS